MTVACTWTFHISTTESPEAIAAEVDRVMQHLLILEQGNSLLTDSAVGLDVDQMVVEISISADGDTFENGLEAAMAAIRTALHAAGGSTPDWPSLDRFLPHAHDSDNEAGIVFEHGELIAC